ncbi:MAG: hypothetical protein ACREPA_08640 [Candidatus Dormibacteraceae bacterium]
MEAELEVTAEAESHWDVTLGYWLMGAATILLVLGCVVAVWSR